MKHYTKTTQNLAVGNCTRGTQTWFVCQMKREKTQCINDIEGEFDKDFSYKNITFECESCLMAPDDKTIIRV